MQYLKHSNAEKNAIQKIQLKELSAKKKKWSLLKTQLWS